MRPVPEFARAGISEKKAMLILESMEFEKSKLELEQCQKLHIFLLTNRDEIYPMKRRQVPDISVLLYGRGKPELFETDAIWESIPIRNGSPSGMIISPQCLIDGGKTNPSSIVQTGGSQSSGRSAAREKTKRSASPG